MLKLFRLIKNKFLLTVKCLCKFNNLAAQLRKYLFTSFHKMSYTCEECKIKFSAKSKLLQHLRSVHGYYNCILCNIPAKKSAQELITHLRETHHSNEFKEIESIAYGVARIFRYEIVGIQNNFNAIFNEEIEAKVKALLVEQFTHHPSYKVNVVLRALYSKEHEDDEEEMVEGFFQSETFIASVAFPDMINEDLEEAFESISNDCEEFIDKSSGLSLIDLVALDIRISKNILYHS